jgi:hypothetical protein
MKKINILNVNNYSSENIEDIKKNIKKENEEENNNEIKIKLSKKKKKKEKTLEEKLSGNNDISEKEFNEIIKYQFRKIIEIRDLEIRKFRVMYCIILKDGSKIFKKPGFLLKVFEDRVMLGNLPDSDIKYHIKKNNCKCLSWTNYSFRIWWVRIKPEGCKTKWYRELTLEESIKKYKSLKHKYKKLADKYLTDNIKKKKRKQ